MLPPATLLDPSRYSEDFFLLSHRPRVPWAFESDECLDLCTPEQSSFSTSMANNANPQFVAPPSGVFNANQGIDVQKQLAPLVVRKPPRPAMLRPLNLSAYTRPNDYESYIKQMLTPPELHAARSSVTNILEAESLANLRKKNGDEFADRMAHEVSRQQPGASEIWVRNVCLRNTVPAEFDEIVYATSDFWNSNDGTFSQLPEFTELGVKEWLNKLAQSLATKMRDIADPTSAGTPGPPPLRTWCKVTANMSPTGGSHQRKPDVSLFDEEITDLIENKDPKKDPMKAGWALVKAFVEVTQNQSYSFFNMLVNIAQKAYLMFESQPFRRYVISLVFINKDPSPYWALVFLDRSGIISTDLFSFKHTAATTLARLVYVLSYGRPSSIGIDESMIVNKYTGLVTHIIVFGQTPTSGGQPIKRIFEVVQPISATPQLSGRATRVWVVRRLGSLYVLKDSWPLKHKPFSEIRHLMKINQTIMKDEAMREKMKHIYPVFIIGQEFMEHDTSVFRVVFGLLSVSARVHRRTVTEPIGDPLTSFNTKFQFCSVLYDVVTYLKYAYEKCQICHGDVSLGNVTIHQVWDDDRSEEEKAAAAKLIEETKHKNDDENDPRFVDPSTALRDPPPAAKPSVSSNAAAPRPSPPSNAYGLVIDHDNSFSTIEGDTDGYVMNSGTLPYLTLDALQWQEVPFKHQPKHDLESLFYVIIAVCTYVDSPGKLRSPVPEDGDRSLCPNEWWIGGHLHNLARSKAAHMSSFTKLILSRLPPYWNDFHEELQQLRDAIWPQNIYVLDDVNVASHDRFLEILDAAKEKYRNIQEVPSEYAFVIEKQGGSSGGGGSQKRKGKNTNTVVEPKRARKTASSPIQSRTSQIRFND